MSLLLVTMRVLVLVCLLGVVLAEEVLEPKELPEVFGYHEKYGVPLAAKIKAAEEATDFDGSRIIGGQTSMHAQVPYMGGLVIILTNGLVTVCGSTMISNTRLVTAAHCWDDGYWRGHTVTVVLGSFTLYFGGTRYATRSVVMHPNWNPANINTLRYNVAIINIRFTAYNDLIRNAALPSGAQLNNNFAGARARAAGYGLLTDESTQGNFHFLYRVYLQVISNEECSRHYLGINNGLLCTSGVGPVGICHGDRGGPLTIAQGNQNVFIGIASFFWHEGCTAQRPSGFTRVTSVSNWIRSHM